MQMDSERVETDEADELAVGYATMIRKKWEAMGQPLAELGGALLFEAMNILFGLGMSRTAIADAMREMADIIEAGEDPRSALTRH